MESTVDRSEGELFEREQEREHRPLGFAKFLRRTSSRPRMDPVYATPGPAPAAPEGGRTLHQRPRGVVILAAVYVVIGVLFAVASVAAFRPSLFLTAVMVIFAGWGLATRRAWAWYLAFILEGFSIVLGLLKLPLGLVGVVLAGVIIWYLLTPRVRSWFARRETTA